MAEMRSVLADHASDADLVASARAGDVSAFEALTHRYRGLAFAFAYHQLGRFDDAEDAAQDALVEAYLKLGHLRDPARFAAWLRRIVSGKAAELARRRREEPLAPEELEAARDPRSEAPDSLEMQVREALQQLPPAVRLATTLFYVEGLSYQEIAAYLEVPASTVRGRLQRARSSLREELIGVVAAGLRQARPGQRFVEGVMSKIASIKVYQQKDEQGNDAWLLHLIEDQGRRFNIYVGQSEAFHIDFQLSEKTADRPMTYALMTTILDGFGLKITRAEVTELKDNTYFALLTIEGNGQVKTFDARPSDAINLALAAGAEIHVDDRVLALAAVDAEPGPDLPAVVAAAEAARRVRAIP
jgi:RNA polymerase sigma factor (sigma-70 family)